jgi:hypothetical protein
MKGYRNYLLTMALVWAGSLLLFVAVYLLVMTPQKNNRTLLEKQFAEKKKTYESAVQASEEETKVKLTREVEDMQARLHEFVIESEDCANLTLDVSRIAGEKQIGSFTTKTSEEVPSAAQSLTVKRLQESKIEIRFASDFTQFAAFLNALERHHPILFVDKFKITRSEGDSKDHKIEMDLAVFVRKRAES